ncbi:MAG: type II toxin-antitoxin system HicB family antitoxin [Cytophagales bacterium]|nr:type II toxin-antitoxin system HicB family antitoxin [Cytophagales bacterium]
MFYYAKIIKDRNEDGYLVTFPDFKNIFTEGETIEEAIKNAGEALNGVLGSDFERDIKIPNPTIIKSRNYYPIEVEQKLEIELKRNSTQVLQ